ncbi:MAG: FG-GAP-like repeat-containing protein [Paludibacter sp.]|nr:FG-GAP-like repeat-containing protein [Paludibacter sp.]
MEFTTGANVNPPIYAPSGTISVLNADYVNNMDEMWDIDTGTSNPVQIDYTLDTEAGDYVIISSIDDYGNITETFPLTGQDSGTVYTTLQSGKVRIEFISNGYVSNDNGYTGFELQFSSGEHTSNVHPTVYESLGSISVKNENYVNFMDEVWNIDVGANVPVRLKYTIDADVNDYLILCSVDDSGNIIDTCAFSCCQGSRTVSTTIPNGKARVQFVSNDYASYDYGYTGFELEYSLGVANPTVHPTIRDAIGVISVQNDSYLNGMRDLWNINTGKNRVLRLSYSIDTEDSCDYVIISDIDNYDNVTGVHSLCGQKSGTIFTTNPNGKVKIEFFSNGSVCSDSLYTGFDILYSLFPQYPDTTSTGTNPTQGSIVGTISGQSGVSQSGAATYTIPIDCPLGINGMQPNISMVYNSQAGNCIAGLGWNIGGLSAIIRSGKDLYHDGIASAPQYNSSDPLTLNGQRLIYVNDKNGYYTEEQSFSLITPESNGFKLITKDGVLYKYGSQTGVLTGTQDSILHWYVDYVEDPMGNYMHYIYEQQNLCMFIKRIEYGNNLNQGTNTTHYLDFYYRSRQDTVPVNYGHFSGKMNRILSKIVSGTNNEVYRTYNLIYYNFDIYSRLVSIKESSSNGTSFNPTVFNWEYLPNSSINTNDITMSYIGTTGFYQNLKDFSYRSADFNGDGLSEIAAFYFPENSDMACVQFYYPKVDEYGNVSSFMCSNFISLPSYINEADWNSMIIGDFYGKGSKNMIFPEFISSSRSVKYTIVNKDSLTKVLQTGMKYGNMLPVSAIGDLNNDGKSEILFIENVGDRANSNPSHHFGKYYNPADSAWHQFSLYYIGGVGGVPLKIFIKDFNADGFSDVLITYSSGTMGAGFTIAWNHGEQWVGNTKQLVFTQNYYSNIAYNLGNINLADIGDFNGDGLFDILVASEDGIACGVHMNLGKEHFALAKVLPEIKDPIYLHCENLYLTGNFIRILDFDLDGKSDLITCYKNYTNNHYNSTTIRWYKSTGTGFKLVRTRETSDAGNISSKYITGDFNGDGQSELMNYGYDCYNKKNITDGFNMYKNALLTYNSGNIVAITNGNNQQVKFDYVNISNNSSNAVYFHNNNVILNYPISNNIPVVSLVRSMKTGYGNEWDETTYQYYEARTHLFGKGFLGFKRNVTKNERQDKRTIKEFTYDNNFFHIYPTMQSVQTYNGLNSISRIDYIYNITEINGRCLLPKLTNILETDSLHNTQTSTTKIIDNNGNLTEQSVETKVLGGATTLRTNTTNNYATISGRIWPNRLSGSTTTYTRTGKPTISKSVSYTYYNSGLLNTEQKYVGTSIKELTTYTYDIFGNPLSFVVKPYNSTGLLTTMYEYTSDGRFPKKITDPLGLISMQTYNSLGQLISKTTKINELEKTTFYDYDAMGRQSKVINPDLTEIKSSLVWVSSPSGALYCSTNTVTGRPTSKIYYDAFGREMRISQIRFDGSELSIDKTYDNLGRLWKISLPFKGANATLWNEYSYDTYDRITQLIHSSGKTDSWTYSGNNITEAKDGISVTKYHDASGALTSITDPAGTITYDLRSDGQPSSIVTSGNVITSFEYDDYGRQISITDPSAGLKNYEYDAAGNLYKEIDALNDTTIMFYDLYNRLTTKVSPEFSTTYSYTSDGNLSSIESTNGTSNIYTYDDLGRISTEKDIIPESKWLQKSYVYSYGNLSSIAYSTQSGSIVTENYIYSNGNLSEMKLNGQTSIWKIDSENDLGQPTQVSNGSLISNYAFNMYGLPIGRILRTQTANISSQSYDFNPQTGNLNWRRDEMRNLLENFSYDGLSRLNCIGVDTIDYDVKGNISKKISVGTFHYNILGKPYAISGVTSYGNAIPLRSQTVGYTSFMRPDSISENDNLAVFSYNAAGNRVHTKFTNASSLIRDRFYVDSKYIVDIVGDSTKEQLFLGGDAYSAPAVYIKDSSTGTWNIYYIYRDYLGSITHVTNSSGSLEQELSYDVWGRLRNPETQELYTPGNEPQLFLGRGYSGHEHLTDFGLINMNSRLYDPALGRFLSPDPFIQAPENSQSFNRYSYCLNNPLKYTDPSGNSWVGNFLDRLDSSLGRLLGNFGITSFSLGYSTNGSFIGMGIGYKNHQDIIVGYSLDPKRNFRFGIGTSYSSPYYIGSYEAMDQKIANGIDNARKSYFEVQISGNSYSEDDAFFLPSINISFSSEMINSLSYNKPSGRDVLGFMNDVGTGSDYASGVIGLTKIGLLEYRMSLPISSKIGTFSSFSTAYRGLGYASRSLGYVGYAGGLTGVYLDYKSLQSGEIGLGRFGYRTGSLGLSIYTGAAIGGPWGAVGGAAVGGFSIGAEYIYDSVLQPLWREVNYQIWNFENALKNGWYPGR